jgi:hypothetical protein
MAQNESYLICVDPGGTTGVGIVGYTDRIVQMVNAYEDTVGPFDLFKDLMSKINNYRDEGLVFPHTSQQHPVTVLIEAWETYDTPFRVNPNYACQLIGAAKVAAAQMGVNIIERSPQARKQVTDQMLKAGGFWWPHGEGHAREALRHGLAFLIEQLHRPTIDLLMPRR